MLREIKRRDQENYHVFGLNNSVNTGAIYKTENSEKEHVIGERNSNYKSSFRHVNFNFEMPLYFQRGVGYMCYL